MLSQAAGPRAYSNKPRLQARDPSSGGIGSTGVSRSATNDLADFLRNSGPTEPPPPPLLMTGAARKEESGAKRSASRFWRSSKKDKEKEKEKGRAYGDMP